MSDFLLKANIKNFTQAEVLAGTAFAFLNFDLSNAAETWIDNIECNNFADVADDPNLTLTTVTIFKNVSLVADQSLGQQLSVGSAQSYWTMRTKRNNDHNLNRQFGAPFVLDKGFRYAITAIALYSAALAATARIDLFVATRVNLHKQDYILKVR